MQLPRAKVGWCKAEKLSGIYAIFGQNNRVYVGQSDKILARPTVDLARRLGLPWSIIRYMPNTTQREREVAETAIHEAYRLAGFNVVSMDRLMVYRTREGSINIAARSAKIRESWKAPERRAKQSERMRARHARMTKEQRSEAMKKVWSSRRANLRCALDRRGG